MDQAIARNIAHYSHLGGRDSYGEPFIEHVERVAAAVPVEARTVAFLHDVLEHTSTGQAELRSRGLSEVELGALELLTRTPTEDFEVHALRIAYAPGPAGRLARAVKLADLDDRRMRREGDRGTPPYGWARQHILGAQRRLDAARQAA